MPIILTTLCSLSLIIVIGFFLSSPVIALFAGMLSSLILREEYKGQCSSWGKRAFGISIILLGCSVHLSELISTVGAHVVPTVLGIFVALIGAYICARVINLDVVVSLLIGVGTAICGASAIAALATALKAPAEKISISLAVILLLNALALIIFPYLGHEVQLSSSEFARWAALSIHDTSSVIGATLSYDPHTVSLATSIKLGRAMWIVPVTLLLSYLLGYEKGTSARPSTILPWFIIGYVVAAASGEVYPYDPVTLAYTTFFARKGFMVGLFLTGISVNLTAVRSMGITPLVVGIVLWICSSCIGFWAAVLK